MNSIGSIWRRWDLHVHTPASFHWNGKPLHEQTNAEREATWRQVANRMNEVDVDAFCIMDYWTFEGYLDFKKFLWVNSGATTKAVFPGIELRLEAPTDHRLNTHLIFDKTLSEADLGLFLSRLVIRGTKGRPPSREELIAVAKGYDEGKLRFHGRKPEDRQDDVKMLRLGMETIVITQESLWDARKMIGEERCLIIQPYDTNDGLEDLDWKRHPFEDSVLMKPAEIFETRDPVHVSLFLGHGHPTKPHVGQEFIQNLGGYPKPVVSGSDAHQIQDYGVYPSDRVTWLKAQPTFAGLQQVCHEPAQRCFIGVAPPKKDHIAQNPTRYIKGLRIAKRSGSTMLEHWFDGFDLSINPGLIAIIGNKGSGKSALADILALAGSTHCEELEFLNDKRFRRGENKAKDFIATLTWADEATVSVSLAQASDRNKPERVRYLPQQFIEDLCNEIASGDDSRFERELKKVIFSHVTDEDRLQKPTLDALIDFKVSIHRKAIMQAQAKLEAVNVEIQAIERELSEETRDVYGTSLSLKQTELEAHEKARPQPVQAPQADPNDLQATQASDAVLRAKAEVDRLGRLLESEKAERRSLVMRSAILARLRGHLSNLNESIAAFFAEHTKEFADAGFTLTDIVKFEMLPDPIGLEFDRVNKRLAEIAVAVNGTEEQKGLEAVLEDASALVQNLQAKLDEPQRLYQNYLEEERQWQVKRAELLGSHDKPDTIEYLKEQIRRLAAEVPEKRQALLLQRVTLVREIHAELARIRAAYQELFSPINQMAARTDLVKESLRLTFDAFLSPAHFEENFLEYIHRNRRGNFYGEEESRKAVRALVSKHDFRSSDGTVAFLEELMAALTKVDRGGTTEDISIQSQLKGTKKVTELYDYVFGLSYLEPHYTLKLGDKDIAQLSPGEKGALLLVFYLLLDRDESPIIIDQPEQNLDNQSVVRLLVDCIRNATMRRQVIIVTHNPNLAVYCDADQIVYLQIDNADGYRISYSAGAIEDYSINKATVDVLEGTYPAFDNRRKKYHRPIVLPTPGQ